MLAAGHEPAASQQSTLAHEPGKNWRASFPYPATAARTNRALNPNSRPRAAFSLGACQWRSSTRSTTCGRMATRRFPGCATASRQRRRPCSAKYGITTPLLVAHVMAQISHECGAGHDVVENLNYTAGRMMQVWPSRFPTMARRAPYAGNPRALANKVYNGRMGNASGSDDGWNFRGRGASQTTGREGYARLAKATGLDLVNHPDLVNDPAALPRMRRGGFRPVRLPAVRQGRRRAGRHAAPERRHRRPCAAPDLACEMEGRARLGAGRVCAVRAGERAQARAGYAAAACAGAALCRETAVHARAIYRRHRRGVQKENGSSSGASRALRAASRRIGRTIPAPVRPSVQSARRYGRRARCVRVTAPLSSPRSSRHSGGSDHA